MCLKSSSGPKNALWQNYIVLLTPFTYLKEPDLPRTLDEALPNSLLPPLPLDP